MKVVSRFCMRVRRKAISLRVFSYITLGSSLVHRRQLGAITIARLLASIFVAVTISGCAKYCRNLEGEKSCINNMVKAAEAIIELYKLWLCHLLFYLISLLAISV